MRWPLAWVVVGAAIVAGCSADDDAASEPTPTPPPEAPTVAEIDPSVLEGLETETLTDFDQTMHATWPVIPGADPLTGELESFVQDRIAAFSAALPESLPPRATASPEPETAARPELNIGWSVVAASPDAIGVRLATYEFFGATGGESWRTFWYDPATGDVRPNADLLAGDDARTALADAVRTQLTSPNSEVDEDDLDAAMADSAWPLAVGFTDDGQLVAEFDQYSVAAGSAGRVAAAVPAAETRDLLSEFGFAALDAAVSPTDPALPVDEPEPTTEPEEPTEEPTTEPAEPAPEPEPDVDCAEEDCVAVTYDDGPARYTDELLQVLDDKNAKATFFLVGQQVAAYSATVQAMHDAGHEIASHTWDHKQLTALSESQIRAQLDRTAELIVDATGEQPAMMRPPYGATNDTVAKVTRDAGLAQILWSVDTRDWADRDPAIVTRRAVDDARPGSIILMHDIHESTVEAAAGVIDGLRDRGFTLVTVSELFDGDLQPGERYNSR